ncbi:hypothetical protein ACTVCO_06460 [Sanguibacter sp. A247]|uniref:hypothetical protein n=1 Tax=unclassified Sanguibacter TaxID=2645534 RepID=UPI003FD73922
MVAHVVKLRLTLWAGSLRRSPWQVVGLVLGLLNAVLIALVLVGSMAYTRTIAEEAWDVTLIVGGALVVVGWWVVPLLAFGVDSALDPRRFALLAVPRRPLLAGLAVAGLLGIPGLTTLVISAAGLLVWLPDVLPVLAGLALLPLVMLTCIAGSRAFALLMEPLLAARRFREVVGVLALAPAVLVAPALGQSLRALRRGADVAPALIEIVGWTPPGAVWAVQVDVAQGRWGRAAAHLAIAVVTAALLVKLWDVGLERALTSPPPRPNVVAQRGAGWFGRLPATPTGAVVARSLTYWGRDSRYMSNLTVLPVLVVALHVLAQDAAPVTTFVAPAIVAFTLGWAIVADIAMDSSAFWLHASAGVRGIADRTGRALAVLVIAVPAVVATLVAGAWRADRWDLVPASLGLSAVLLGGALGISSIVSAWVLFAVPAPGDGPFSTPHGSATANLFVQSIAWTVVMVLATPSIVLAVLVWRGSAAAGWGGLVLGLGLGAVLLVAGLRGGARIYDARVPELVHALRSRG